MADNKPINARDYRNMMPSKRGNINQDRSPYNPENSLFKRLTKLFSGPIVNRRQQNYKSERRRRLDKYKFQSAQGQQFKKSSYNPFDYVHSQSMANQNRAERYVDFEQMEYTPEIASALDIYADEMTTSNSLEKVLTIDCPNEEIKNVLNGLYYDILNIEFNLFGWCRTMCKFGDFFLYLDIDDKDGVKNAIGLPPYEVERIEGEDEKNPNYVQFQWNSGGMTFENWQMGHFRILGNDKYAPYGTSILEAARRIWRQLTLLEDAMMAYRIVRSAERRVFYIDVGNVAPNDIEQFMQKAMTSLKRNQVVDEKTGRVDLRYNPLSIEEDYFIPVRGTQSTKIESLAGGQYTGDIDDVKYLRDKLFSAIKIPQSYLARGEGGEEDKTTLAQKDIRFARTIQRLQRSVVSELEKIGIIHLFVLGYRNEDLIKFKLRLNNPSKIAELQELETWKTKFEVATAATEGYFSKRWVAKKIFGMSDEEFLRNQREMFFDFKFKAAVEKAGTEAEAAAGDQDAGLAAGAGGGLETGGGMPTGGNEGSGLDLGALTSEPEGAAATAGGAGATPPAGETPPVGPKDDTLLAAPGKRDDRLTSTPASKGKVYLPVKYRGGDRRPAGARTRNYQSKFSKELGGGSMRNVWGSGTQDLFGLGNGIYEQYEDSYNEEIINEGMSNKDINITEEKIMANSDSLKKLLSSLEKKETVRKETDEE
jgi:Bacteriophage T4-like portal protein (Gp20)